MNLKMAQSLTDNAINAKLPCDVINYVLVPYLDFYDRINLNMCLSPDARITANKLSAGLKEKLCAMFNTISIFRFFNKVEKVKLSRYRTSLIYKFYTNIENYIYFLESHFHFERIFYEKIEEFKYILLGNSRDLFLSPKYKQKFYRMLVALPGKIKAHKKAYAPSFPKILIKYNNFSI